MYFVLSFGCFWRNLHRWQEFNTAAGSDGIDRFHLWFLYDYSYILYTELHLITLYHKLKRIYKCKLLGWYLRSDGQPLNNYCKFRLHSSGWSYLSQLKDLSRNASRFLYLGTFCFVNTKVPSKHQWMIQNFIIC